MSEENIQLLRRAWESFVNRDPAGLEYLHADVVFEVGPETLPDGGVYRGHDGFREVVALWAGAWGEYRQEPVEFVDLGGDQALVVARTSVRSQETGMGLVTETVYVYELRDGKILRIQTARDREEALARAGRAAD